MNMPKVFVTADLHFSHANIIAYENRPFKSIYEMNKSIIENWNSVVSEQDSVFVLGDVSFTTYDETKALVSQLHGDKTLILGNHDRDVSMEFWLSAGFKEVSSYPILYKEFAVLSHEPPAYFNSYTPYVFIYGHVHSTNLYRTITSNAACVSVERWNYTPVDIERIFALMNKAKEGSENNAN